MDADRKAAGSLQDGHGEAGQTEEVHGSGATHGFEEADGLSRGEAPFPLSRQEGRDATDGQQKGRVGLHLTKEAGAETISQGELFQDLDAGGLGGRMLQEFGASPVDQFRVCRDELAFEGVGGDVEEEVPGGDDALHGARHEGFDGDTLFFQEGRGGKEGAAHGFVDGNAAPIFHEANATRLGGRGSKGRGRDRQREGIIRVIALQNFKEQFDIGDGAGHGADDAEEAARMGDGRLVAGGGAAAGGGLEADDAAEVGGHADGAAAITADAAGREIGGDGGSFAAAAAAGRAGVVEGVSRPAGDGVVGFVVGKKLRAVGFAEEDGAGLTEAGHGGGVAGGAVLEAVARAAEGGRAFEIERIFDGDRDTVQRTFDGCTIERFGLGQCSVGVDVDEGAKGGVMLLDARQMETDQLKG